MPSEDTPTGTPVDRLALLQAAGVSIWLDTLSRDLLDSGDFERLVRERHVTGATSNPTIFAKAITGSGQERYGEQLRALVDRGVDDPRELFFELALDDVRRAADILRPVYDATGGADGFVSFECTPDLAGDTEGTIAQALDLWRRLARPNAMIKVPATRAGVPAIEELTGRGVNVNVTLLFSVGRYEAVIDAFIRGAARETGPDPFPPLSFHPVASVASFFVSRVDSKADALLPEDSPLRGRVAVANAQRAYSLFRRRFEGWDAARALPQRPLWASTGTKNPAYSDVLYVERLIAPDVVNTMPLATLEAFADHGEVDPTRAGDAGDHERVLRDAASAGLDLGAITAELEREGVEAFCRSYEELLAAISEKAGSTVRAG